VREPFGLSPVQQLQVIALPGQIELVPSQSSVALRGFLQGALWWISTARSRSQQPSSATPITCPWLHSINANFRGLGGDIELIEKLA
jgi:hypothetical protein